MATGPRMSARDLAGPVAIFLGALLLVAAIALPLYYVGTLKKTPMDLDITSVSDSQAQQGVSGSDALPAKIFNRCSLEGPRAEVSDAHLTDQQRVLVVDPADADKVTFQAGNSVRIDSYTDGRQRPHSLERGDEALGLLIRTHDQPMYRWPIALRLS